MRSQLISSSQGHEATTDIYVGLSDVRVDEDQAATRNIMFQKIPNCVPLAGSDQGGQAR